jgi:carboxymethylenebutenolidase
MPSSDLLIPTPDGECTASLHVPSGEGPWPAVIMFPDAGGLRPTFREMGAQLAELGFVVLVPDIYYRSGGYEPFDMSTVFSDPEERTRLGTLALDLMAADYIGDAAAFLDVLTGLEEVVDGPVGTTGYCLGGRLSLTVAGRLGDRIGAAASFHGGRLAVEDDPGSPHHLAPEIRAVVYVGYAENDGSFDAEQLALLQHSCEGAGVVATIEEYTAPHGFAVPDNPTYDETAAARHWAAMQTLFTTSLPH